jgi:uncharacterized membrane protein (UPF0127 family)
LETNIEMLINERTGKPVATVVEVADTRAARNQGLLGREGLDASHAFVLSPCFAIHTAFMRFPIDVLFVDRDGCAVKIVPSLAPWRLAMAIRARHVVELAAGELRGSDVRVGDRLYLTTAAGDADERLWSASSGVEISLRTTA